jgi:peptidoglycan hydrolase CwlO-like protein
VAKNFVLRNSFDLPHETVQKFTQGTADESLWQLDGRQLVSHLEETKKCNVVVMDRVLKMEQTVASISETAHQEQQRNEKLESENKLLREKLARTAETLTQQEKLLDTIRTLLKAGHAGK